MPTVVNGIGTWYYGKRRIHTRKGTCEFCGNLGDLTSYDTTLYFVVVFVPIIPLARKRILEQCAVCQKHRVLSLSKWEDAKVKDGAVVLEKLRTDPDDRASLLHALGFVQGYQDEPLFNEVIEPLAAERTDDAAIQAQLGETYAYFARWAKAEEAYRASLAREDNEIIRERLGWALLKQGRPREAEPFLRHIIDGKRQDLAGLIYFLINGYQAAGLHEEALALMDERDRAFPEAATIKEYQKQRQTSVRYRGTDKKVRSAFLDEAGTTGYQQGTWTARLPGLIAALLLLGVVGLYLGSALWIGQARKVFLVNGTGKPYTVAIAGSEHSLPARSATPVRVAEGDIEVAFPQVKPALAPIHCRVETSFWSRPFSGPTFVINPDQTALVVEEETIYAKVAPPPGKSQFHFGKPFYSFSGLDYEFQEFPPKLQVKGSQTVTKTRVALGPALDGLAQVLTLQQLPEQERIDVCRRVLLLDPGNVVILYWLSSQMKPEPMLELLKSRLEDRPLLIDWHRAYQTVMEKAHPETDLRPDYQKIVAETKEQPDAVYLLGRLETDWDTAKKLFQKAADASPPSAYAMYALAHHALSDGEFKAAVNLSEKALPLIHDKTLIRTVHHEALLANGSHDRLLGLLQNETQTLGMQLPAFQDIVRVNAIRGDKAKAREVMAKIVQQDVPERRQQTEKELEAMLCCCEGDRAGYVKKAADAGQQSFELAFLQGRLEQAATLAGKNPHDADICHALLYLAATRSKAKELAETHWKALLADLGKQGRDERLLADVLAGRKEPKRALQRMAIEPRRKRVFLVLLAQRYPAQAKEALALARKLDFQRDALSLCLRDVRPP
jgi:tetratricopeptide (TPR) repeat protein